MYHKKVALVSISVIIAVAVIGCAKRKEQYTSKLDTDKIIENVMKPDPTKVALLAAKYEIDPSNVVKLLEKYSPPISYSGSPDELLAEMQKPHEAQVQSAYQKLASISQSAGIPLRTLADLLIDYENLSHDEKE